MTYSHENDRLEKLMEPKIKKNEDATVEIEGEISTEDFEKHRTPATEYLGRDVELPGFRKGKAPADVVMQHIGEGRVLQEMANRALAHHLPTLFTEHKIDPIGRPNITITKLAPNNPLGFKLSVATLPEITLPDYTSIAHKHPDPELVEVTEKDIEDAITEIRKRAHAAEQQIQDKDTSDKTEPPELTDAFVQKLGEYKNVAEFKEKLIEQIRGYKTQMANEKRRAEIINEIVKETKTKLPDLLVESELNKMIARFKDDVARVGAKWEDYLKQIKKTEEELRKEWRPDAEKSATTQLVLNEIAKQEGIRPDEKQVHTEVSHILEHHKDADKTSVRIYVETLLTNQKVFEFLEKQKVQD